MSILGNIMSSILGGRSQPPPPPASLASAEPQHAPAQPGASRAPPVAPTPPDVQRAAQQPQAAHSERQPAAAAATPQVDVAAVLDKLAAETDQQLNWRTSIVDLMKLLKLDSSLAARKTLAAELNYTGSTKDSAAMNI